MPSKGRRAQLQLRRRRLEIRSWRAGGWGGVLIDRPAHLGALVSGRWRGEQETQAGGRVHNRRTGRGQMMSGVESQVSTPFSGPSKILFCFFLLMSFFFRSGFEDVHM